LKEWDGYLSHFNIFFYLSHRFLKKDGIFVRQL
jgi:hypothetical protein